MLLKREFYTYGHLNGDKPAISAQWKEGRTRIIQGYEELWTQIPLGLNHKLSFSVENVSASERFTRVCFTNGTCESSRIILLKQFNYDAVLLVDLTTNQDCFEIFKGFLPRSTVIGYLSWIVNIEEVSVKKRDCSCVLWLADEVIC